MFAFPEDARWCDSEDAVEFDVRLGDYRAKGYVPRRVFQHLIGSRPSSAECVEYFHLNRTVFERVAEAKVRARQLDDDANIRISGRDLSRFKW